MAARVNCAERQWGKLDALTKKLLSDKNVVRDIFNPAIPELLNKNGHLPGIEMPGMGESVFGGSIKVRKQPLGRFTLSARVLLPARRTAVLHRLRDPGGAVVNR